MFPMVAINGQIFRGQINPDNVFEAICAGYTTMPQGCKRWLNKEGITVQEEGMTTDTVILIVLLLVAFNTFLFFVYRYYLQLDMKKDMKIQVSSAVS